MFSEKTKSILEEKEKEMSPYLKRRFQMEPMKNIQNFMDTSATTDKKESFKRFLMLLNTIN